jgi:hypothetical protein
MFLECSLPAFRFVFPSPPFSALVFASVSFRYGFRFTRFGVCWQIGKNSREDFREEIIFSVDPPGCRDIDDALHVKELPNGNYELGVCFICLLCITFVVLACYGKRHNTVLTPLEVTL